MKIFLLVPRGGIVLGAHTREELAIVHERCMLGVEVVECELRDTLPSVVRDDLTEFDDVENTPVVPLEDIDDAEA
jgi:hypothetical protein